MSGTKISGQELDVFIAGVLVHFEKITLSIEDASKATHSKGVPNGQVKGKLSATGEVEVDTDNFLLIIEAARIAGSFQKLPAWDAVFHADTSNQALNVIAHSCLLKISSLIDASGEGGEKLVHKLPFEVTSKDFIHINGVPYHETDKFLGLF